MQATSLKPENAKAMVILLGGVVVIVLLVVFVNKTFGGLKNFFGSITDGLGITDSPERAAAKQAVSNATAASANVGSPWSPQFYKNAPAGASLITQAGADNLAAQIWDSVGIFSADIQEAYGAFKQLHAKSQVSFLADRFYQNYQKDLFSWLTLQYTKMGSPDPVLQQISNYVDGLSNY
jgi:hypothetical protein